MADFNHILRQAQRRELADRALRRGGWGLTAGIGVACALVLILRLSGIDVTNGVPLALPVIGLLSGIIHAVIVRPAALTTAVGLDRALRLKDRFGSARALDQPGSAHIDDVFLAMLRADAERLAQSIDVRPVTPIRLTRIWSGALVLGALLWIGVEYLPVAPRGSPLSETGLTPEQAAHLQPQAQQVAQMIESSIKDLPKDDPVLDSRTREDLAALDRLSQQLSQPPTSAKQLDKAREETAARMNELADRLSDQAERDLSSTDQLAQKFSGMDSTGAPKPPMSAEEFQQALKRGDFGAAARELQELLDHPDQLPPHDKQAVADHLRDTASRLKDDSRGEHPDAAEHREQIEQTLRDQGLTPEQIDKLERMLRDNPEAADEMRRALEQQHLDPEAADKLARDLESMQDQQTRDEQVQRDLKDISQSLNDAAEQVEHPEQREPQDAEQPENTPPATQPQRPTDTQGPDSPRGDLQPTTLPQPPPRGDEAPPQPKQPNNSSAQSQPDRSDRNSTQQQQQTPPSQITNQA